MVGGLSVCGSGVGCRGYMVVVFRHWVWVMEEMVVFMCGIECGRRSCDRLVCEHASPHPTPLPCHPSTHNTSISLHKHTTEAEIYTKAFQLYTELKYIT